MSSTRHRSDHQHRGGDRASNSTGSSGSQRYVLPATTYAGSAGGHNSGGSQYASSSGASARGHLYDQYARDHRSTPSGSGSQRSQEVPIAHYPSTQHSQEVPIAHYPSGNSGAQQRRASTPREGPSQGSGSEPRPAPIPGQGQPQGYGPARSNILNARAYAMQREIDAQGPITYGTDSRSAEKARDLKRNAVSRFVRKSAEKAKEKLLRKK